LLSDDEMAKNLLSDKKFYADFYTDRKRFMNSKISLHCPICNTTHVDLIRTVNLSEMIMFVKCPITNLKIYQANE